MTLFRLLLGIVVVAALAGLAWWWLRTRAARHRAAQVDDLDTITAWRPQATRVLSGAEREAFDQLRKALPGFTILAQVPLARFIKVPTRYSYAEWLRRVGHLCVDFVVCDHHAQVLGVVELQSAGGSHHERAQRRQKRVERVLTAAGIPVHTWREEVVPDVPAIRKAFAPALAEAAVEPEPAARAVAHASSHPVAPAAPGVATTDAEASAPMPLRDAPPSTWFDDVETAAAPLSPPRAEREFTPR